MKAIHKFKSLTSRSRAGTPVTRAFGISLLPEYSPRERTAAEDPESTTQTMSSNTESQPTATMTSTTSSSSTTTTTPATSTSASSTLTRQKSIAEEAAELIEQRKAFIASAAAAADDHPLRLHHPHAATAPVPGERGHAHDLTDRPPLLLGIGTGGRDDFLAINTSNSSDPGAANTSTSGDGEGGGEGGGGAETYVVSDSPTGIDFDVYDRAFEAEVKRIRSQKHHHRGRARTYLTRLVGERELEKYAADDCMVLEAGKDIASAAKARMRERRAKIEERLVGGTGGGGGGVRGSVGSVGLGSGVGAIGSSKFADLVAQMTKGRTAGSESGSGSGSGSGAGAESSSSPTT